MDYRSYISIYWTMLVALTILHMVRSQCNVCAVGSSFACSSETAFRMCTTDGTITGRTYNCAENEICSQPGGCIPNNDSVISPCADCDQCDGAKTFACKGLRQFALCMGNNEASIIVGECKDDYVCNIDYRFICASIADGFYPTCNPTIDNPVTPTPSRPSTTPSPITQPSNFCSFFNQTGRFPVGSNPNTTCRQYLLCIERNDIWIGALYYCPNRYFYDDVSRSCTSNPPSRCSTGVRSLSIFDISFY